eukprot:9359440-Alexandrium_andersonii.AAC.1
MHRSLAVRRPAAYKPFKCCRRLRLASSCAALGWDDDDDDAATCQGNSWAGGSSRRRLGPIGSVPWGRAA